MEPSAACSVAMITEQPFSPEVTPEMEQRDETRDPKYYRLTDKAGAGRTAVASVNIKKGTIIMQEEPYAMAINKQHAEVTCTHCGVTSSASGTVFQCSPEDPMRYCSESCITTDYPVHQLEIERFNSLARFSSVFGDIVLRLLIRIACLRKYEDVKGGTGLQCQAQDRFPLLGRWDTYLLLIYFMQSLTYETSFGTELILLIVFLCLKRLLL